MESIDGEISIMKIEIDQSGRVEYTSKPTVLAFADGKTYSIIFLSRDKKYLQKIFRRAGIPNMFVYKVFAILIFLLIKDFLKSNDEIIIDQEYLGHDKMIKQFLIELFRRYKINLAYLDISFRHIGKKSIAHQTAIEAYRAKRADRKITLKDILRIAF